MSEDEKDKHMLEVIQDSMGEIKEEIDDLYDEAGYFRDMRNEVLERIMRRSMLVGMCNTTVSHYMDLLGEI